MLEILFMLRDWFVGITCSASMYRPVTVTTVDRLPRISWALLHYSNILVINCVCGTIASVTVFAAFVIGMQNWSTLLEQGCLDQLSGSTECDDVITSNHISSGGCTIAANCTSKHSNNNEDMSSKKQLRCIYHLRTAVCLNFCCVIASSALTLLVWW